MHFLCFLELFQEQCAVFLFFQFSDFPIFTSTHSFLFHGLSLLAFFGVGSFNFSLVFCSTNVSFSPGIVLCLSVSLCVFAPVFGDVQSLNHVENTW